MDLHVLQSNTFFSLFKRQKNGSGEQNMRELDSQTALFWTLALFTRCVISGKLLNLNLSMVHFLHSQNEDDDSICIIAQVGEVKELICAKPWEMSGSK